MNPDRPRGSGRAGGVLKGEGSGMVDGGSASPRVRDSFSGREAFGARFEVAAQVRPPELTRARKPGIARLWALLLAFGRPS